MATTLTINLDDKSGPGLEALIRRLVEGESAAEDFGETIEQEVSPELEKLSEIHAELIKQNEGLSTSQRDLAEQFESTGNGARSFSEALDTSAEGARKAIDIYRDLRGEIKKYETEAKVADKVIRFGMRAANTAMKVDGAVAEWLATESASKSLAKSLGSLASVAAGATAGWKGLMAVADRTGETLRKSGDGFAFLAAATNEQKDAFAALRNEAGEMGRTLDDQLRISGKSYADFSLEVTTNGDRIREAMSKLGGEIAAPFRDVANMTRDWWRETDILASTWKAFDESFTNGSNNAVENLGMIQDGVRSLRASILNLGGTGAGDRYLEELATLERQQEAVGKLAAANEKNRPDFAALREGNALRDRAIEQEKELSKLRGRGLGVTSDLNREQQEIKRLRDELNVKAGQAAQEGRFATRRDDAGNVTMQGYDQEHARLMAVVDQRERELENRRKEIHREVLARHRQEEEDAKRTAQRELDDRIDKSRRRFEEQERIEEQARKRQEDEDRRALFDRLEAHRQHLREKVRAEEEAARESRQRVAELARRFEGGTRLDDAKNQSLEIERQKQQQLAQLRQQATQQWFSQDVKGFWESQQKQLQILADSLKAQQDLRAKFGKEGNVLDQIKNQFSDRDIANKIAQDRAQEAIRKLAEKDPDGLEKYRDQQRLGKGQLSKEDNLEANKFKAQMEKAIRDAQRQVNQLRHRGGQFSDEEVTKATDDLTKQTIDGAEKNGQLNAKTADGLRAAADALKANAEKTIEQGDTISELITTIGEIQAQLEANDGRDARGRALRGGRR